MFGEPSGVNWRWPAAEGNGPGGHWVSHQSTQTRRLAVQPAIGYTPGRTGFEVRRS